jgi:predicted extracellular nuclease
MFPGPMSRLSTRRGATAAALTTVAAVTLAPLGLGGPATATTHEAGVFISELHYDNDGTDVGEAVEVQAPVGTELDGWSLVLYNGNGGTPYGTLGLSGAVPEAGVVVEAAPGLQNGAPDGVALVDAAGVVVEFLSYEGSFTAAGGPADGRASTDIGVEQAGSPVGESLQRLDGAWSGPAPSSFGAVNSAETDPAPECGGREDAVALISDIQGSGATFDSGCSGVQTVEAVVTAVKPGLSGFYLQEEATDGDGEEATSEGIFVRTGSAGIPQDLQVGQPVRVTGTVAEYAGGGSPQTQLTEPTVEILDVPHRVIAPTPVAFPVATTTALEQYEGMLVQLVDTLVISEYFNYDRFGEVVLALERLGQDRLHTPTAVVEPGPDAQALFDEYDLRTITLDDYNSSQNPASVPHPGNGEPFAPDNSFRGGDTVTGVEGVVDHTFGRYRLQPTTYGTYDVTNPRPVEAPEVGGRVSVASFNVLNYFLTVDQADVCGANEAQDCRGADSAAELERQRAKILEAMAELDADVFGLMEMENTPGVDPAADLAAGLNDLVGAHTYSSLDTGVIGTDAIRLGYIYKPAVLSPAGDFEVLDSGDDPRFVDTANRPMLTQTFDEVATGERFTLSVNHLKSKGSACAGDPDVGDGAGNCNLTRTQAAQAIVDFLETDPTSSGDPDHLVIGDLNSYDHEDPVDVLLDAGYTDLVKQHGGEHAYSYVFDGMVGYLDHALSNQSLTPQVTGAAEWHINADEPDILDYNLDYGRPATFHAPDAYRSSDHDPVLVGLDLAGEPTSPAAESMLTAKARPFPYGTQGIVEVEVTAEQEPTGTVEVRDGERVVGTGEVYGGRAVVVLDPESLQVGHHVLDVAYLGSETVAASRTTVRVHVRKAT